MTTFPLDELYGRLDESERRIIDANRKLREERLSRGDFDKHAKRIMRMPRWSRADEEVMWLGNYRPDIPSYKIRMLEWQLLCKFEVAKAAAWINMRKLLLPAAGQYRKATDATHPEICSHLFHVICEEVMGNDRVMRRIREFVRCFSDEELSRFIHSAAEFKREAVPKYFVGFMLLRPTLIQSQKDHIIDQMRGSQLKYRGFERIARLMAQLKFCFYTPEQSDVLAEKFVGEIETMYVLKDKDPLSQKLDDIGSCERHRENAKKMLDGTFVFFKEYSIKRGFCDSKVNTVSDLICAIPTEMSHPIRRVLTYALLVNRRSVPNIEHRRVMGLWIKDLSWDLNLDEEHQMVKDPAFSYHICFESIARFINRFDMKSEGFKNAITQSGGDVTVRLVTLALLYDAQYGKALNFVDQFLHGRSHEQSPSLHFTRLLILLRLKKFDEAIAVALRALFHAEKNGWTSSTTAPILPQNARRQQDTDEEDLDEYLDDVEEEVKISSVNLINERDVGLCACHIILNIIRCRWNEKDVKGDTYYQVLVALSQLNFVFSGRKLFLKLIAEIEKKQVLQAPGLLAALQNRFIISHFSRIFHQSMDTQVVVCEEMNAKIGTSEEEREKHKREVMEVFSRAHIDAKEDANRLIPSISRFLALHASEIYKRIIGNEDKEFVLEESSVAVKEEPKEEVVEKKDEEGIAPVPAVIKEEVMDTSGGDETQKKVPQEPSKDVTVEEQQAIDQQIKAEMEKLQGKSEEKKEQDKKGEEKMEEDEVTQQPVEEEDMDTGEIVEEDEVADGPASPDQ